MSKPIHDAGMIQMFLMRLNEDRLPRAMEIWKRVESGECLSEYDMQFMESVLGDATTVKRLAQKYPEYQGLVDKVSALYAQITEKATENEKKVSGHLS